MTTPKPTRRAFLALSAAATAAAALPSRGYLRSAVPVGIEMYSVREELQRDLAGTVKAVAALGYQGLEFYGPYFDWSLPQTREVRKLLDDLGIRCYSTHNDFGNFSADKIKRAGEMNVVLGSGYVVMASAGDVAGADGWKRVAETLNRAALELEASGLKVGYHNHQPEFRGMASGGRPIEILAKNTKPSVALQLDVGTCLESGSDPVAWIKANPGRIRSMHLKDWSAEPSLGYRALFGEGQADWKAIFEAAEAAGGIEYYLVEQEGSRFSELDTAGKCLEAFRKLRPA